MNASDDDEEKEDDNHVQSTMAVRFEVREFFKPRTSNLEPAFFVKLKHWTVSFFLLCLPRLNVGTHPDESEMSLFERTIKNPKERTPGVKNISL